MVYTKFHRNRPLTTLVTRWRTLKTFNRVFLISQKWDVPGYSTKPLNFGWNLDEKWAKDQPIAGKIVKIDYSRRNRRM